MRKLMTLNGHATNSNDPQRGVWYSNSCGYWTDDWSKLRRVKLRRVGPGIPCCPHCGSPGFQSTFGQWQSYIDQHEESNPGFRVKAEAMRERCAKVLQRFLPDDSDT